MAAQKKMTPVKPAHEAESTPERRGPARKGEELKGQLDDLLDEVGEALEENAEDFVANYVQRGGE